MLLLSRWWSFILGYVVIIIEGNFTERFINMASSRGIIMWDVAFLDKDRIKAKVRIHQFGALRHIARRQQCRVRIKHKRGLPFLIAKLQKRKMLVVGAVIFSMLLYTMSSFVWFIEVQGTDKVRPEQILTVAESHGLKVGAMKRDYDEEEVERALGNLPQIAWVGIQEKGTKVTIEIAEKVLVDIEEDQKQPAHQVAKRDGVIEELLVLVGIPAVQEGDTVQKGQVLISGRIFPESEDELTATSENGDDSIINMEPKKVRAKGIAKARTWYQEQLTINLAERGYNKTGEKVTTTSVRIKDKEIVIQGPRKIPYEHYDKDEEIKRPSKWRNMAVAIEVISRTYYEKEPYTINYNVKEAIEKATKEAKGRVELRIPQEAVVKDTYVEHLNEEERAKNVEVKVTVEILEDIAEPRAIH
ncbi:hypothetical protein GGQ84_001582 [Desulfitispora alkaliphila]|uniref:sporulation protein YqfD n=1 Tax=Desulfitispora alkaliphila TaxID=622674 RepID=UPI003D2214EE